MRIIVGTLTGRKITVNDIDPSDNFETLAHILFESEGIIPSSQRFIFAGKEIEQGRTFTDYNVQNDSLIHLVLRLGGKDKATPTVGLIAHKGIEIIPRIKNVKHVCTNEFFKENYLPSMECEDLYYRDPLILKCNLSELCRVRPECKASCTVGSGGIIDKTKVDKWGNKQYCFLRVYELRRGKEFEASVSKMINNRVKVVDAETNLVDYKDIERKEKCKYYGGMEGETPKSTVTRKYFPKNKRCWKKNTKYLVHLFNHYGGIRFTFITRPYKTSEVEDYQNRMAFFTGEMIDEHRDHIICIKDSGSENKVFKSFLLL